MKSERRIAFLPQISSICWGWEPQTCGHIPQKGTVIRGSPPFGLKRSGNKGYKLSLSPDVCFGTTKSDGAHCQAVHRHLIRYFNAKKSCKSTAIIGLKFGLVIPKMIQPPPYECFEQQNRAIRRLACMALLSYIIAAFIVGRSISQSIIFRLSGQLPSLLDFCNLPSSANHDICFRLDPACLFYTLII